MDVEGPELYQKIETTLSLPIEGINPVKFIINVDPQILKILHNVHTDPLDGNRGQQHLGPPKVLLDPEFTSV